MFLKTLDLRKNTTCAGVKFLFKSGFLERHQKAEWPAFTCACVRVQRLAGRVCLHVGVTPQQEPKLASDKALSQVRGGGSPLSHLFFQIQLKAHSSVVYPAIFFSSVCFSFTLSL